MHHRSSGPCRFTPGALAPVRVVVSRSILTYSAPCAPLTGTARLHRRAAYTRCPRCVPRGPRRPVSGSELSLTVLYRPVALWDPGKFIGCLHPVPSPTTLAFDYVGHLGTSEVPHPPILVGRWFSRFTYGLLSLQPVRFARPPVGADRGFPQPTRTFTSGLSTDWSPAPSPDMTTVATG